jgi:hypothetical protein
MFIVVVKKYLLLLYKIKVLNVFRQASNNYMCILICTAQCEMAGFQSSKQ